jgi:hypothetical protein
MKEELVKCRGINGSIILSRDKLVVVGVGLGSAQHDIKFGDVSSIIVERKSMIPFLTLTILAAIVLLVVRFNLLWFILNLYTIQLLVIPIAPWLVLAILIACVAPTILRLIFVNVSVRSGVGISTLYLVPLRSAKQLASRFSEISAGG